MMDCGLHDCNAVAEQNRQADEERRQRRLARRCGAVPRASSRPAWAGRAHPACPPERALPRRSVMGPDVAGREYGEAVKPSQSEFEASGAAESQDAILIKFFEDPKTHGKLFPMIYLEEISGARRMNNRAIALRKHFEPLGFGFWNEQRPFGPTKAMHSHYGLFPLAEIQRMERDLVAEQERRKGQTTLV